MEPMNSDNIVSIISGFYFTVLTSVLCIFLYKHSPIGIPNRLESLKKELIKLDRSLPLEIVCDWNEHWEIVRKITHLESKIEALRIRITFDAGENSVQYSRLMLLQEHLDVISIRVLDATMINSQLPH